MFKRWKGVFKQYLTSVISICLQFLLFETKADILTVLHLIHVVTANLEGMILML